MSQNTDFLLLMAKEDDKGLEIMGWYWPMNRVERNIIRKRYRIMLSQETWWKSFTKGHSEEKMRIVNSILSRQGRDGAIKLNRKAR
jgi:hypothetical protein